MSMSGCDESRGPRAAGRVGAFRCSHRCRRTAAKASTKVASQFQRLTYQATICSMGTVESVQKRANGERLPLGSRRRTQPMGRGLLHRDAIPQRQSANPSSAAVWHTRRSLHRLPIGVSGQVMRALLIAFAHSLVRATSKESSSARGITPWLFS